MHIQQEQLIALLYELASLDGRAHHGLTLTPNEGARLHALRAQFEGDEQLPRRRGCRRISIQAPCVIAHHGRRGSAELCNISGAGALVRTQQVIIPEDRIELRVGPPSHTVYVFSALVRRVQWVGTYLLVGVEFDGIPLQLRAYRVRPLAALAVPDLAPPRGHSSSA